MMYCKLAKITRFTLEPASQRANPKGLWTYRLILDLTRFYYYNNNPNGYEAIDQSLTFAKLTFQISNNRNY